ncbi:MAG: prepilin-type N-terminal cleavage/methylation domain-containing protein [Phycisphaerales bacterium]
MSRDTSSATDSRPTRGSARRGFSLVEVLLAVFILGIGVISIAAIFPAGISLQRQSSDDTLGPLVAQNALGVIRSKVTASDFGSFADFYTGYPPFTLATPMSNGNPVLTVEGDWPWMRPGFTFDDPSTPLVDEGAIDIFSHDFTRKAKNYATVTLDVATEMPQGWPTNLAPAQRALWGIPYNPTRYLIADPTTPEGQDKSWLRARPEPRFLITQRERYWPMASNFAGTSSARPQYTWECMFRRFQGRVYVAVFVYRTSLAGGSTRLYTVAKADGSLAAADCPQDPQRSPLPMIFLPPVSGTNVWVAQTPSATVDPADIPNTGPSSTPTLDLTKPRFMWQVPGQWLLDQSNNVHRVLRGRRYQTEGPVRFARPIPRVAPAAAYGITPGTPTNDATLLRDGIWQAWFMPIRDANGFTITPVYVTVEEL